MSYTDPSPSPSPVERMNAHDLVSPSFPAYVGVAGVLVGSALPFALAAMAPNRWTSSLDRSDSVLAILQSFGLFSVLFLVEFFLGIKARSASAEASFSPAAAQMANIQPYQVIQCNRIHQNQIESACIYVPAVLSAAAAGAQTDWLFGTSLTWVLSRVLYRWGYTQESNPLWRLFGTAASLSQSFLCLTLLVVALFNN